MFEKNIESRPWLINENNVSQVNGSSQVEDSKLLTDNNQEVNNQKSYSQEQLEKLITILKKDVNNIKQFLELLTKKCKEVNNLIEEFVNNYDEVLNKLSETDKNFLLIARDFGLSYSILNKLNIKPPTFERGIRKLINFGLIQKLDSKYKEHWIQRNKSLLGKSYKTLISSIYHRNKLKIYVLTEKGKKIVDKLLKFSNEQDFKLYSKLKELKERIEREINKRLQQQKAIEEENKKKLLEIKQKQEEEFQEKLKKAKEFFNNYSNSSKEGIEYFIKVIEAMEEEGKEITTLETDNYIITFKKINDNLLFNKFLVNLYDLIHSKFYKGDIYSFETQKGKYIISGTNYILRLSNYSLFKISKKEKEVI